MPDPRKILTTIRRATDLCRATPGRQGSVVQLADADEVMVVGDLHGHNHTFAAALKDAALDAHPRRHLVLQELVHGPFSYPDDRGDRSHQLVDIVSALKCQYPDRVHLILGNHELSELTGRPISKNGVALNVLFRQGVSTAYGGSADEIYRAYLDLFATLPLAVRTENRVFLCHTIPDARYLDDFDPSILLADEWPAESLARGGSVYAMTWGRDTEQSTIDRFAKIVDADLFITGHQPCDDGFRRANDRLLIIDGTNPFPAYCRFPARGPITIDSLVDGVRIVPLNL